MPLLSDLTWGQIELSQKTTFRRWPSAKYFIRRELHSITWNYHLRYRSFSLKNVLSNSSFFVAAPRTSLAGLQSIVTALPYTEYKTEVLYSLLSAYIYKMLFVKINIFNNGTTPQPTRRPAAVRLRNSSLWIKIHSYIKKFLKQVDKPGLGLIDLDQILGFHWIGLRL